MSWFVEVKVLDPSDDSLKAYFSNRVDGGAAIHELEYSLSRIGGCGDLTLEVRRERADGHSVSMGDIIEVYTTSANEAVGRRYRGMVISQDTDIDEGTARINAVGFWNQFEWAVVVDYIEGADLDDVVSGIWTAMKAQTWCESSATVSVASPAALGDVEITFQEASKAIEKLAEIQGDVDYGVDEDGTFYFQDRTTTKRAHFQIGRTATNVKITERMNDLYNDVLLKTRGIVSNGALTLNRSDSTSITSYKKRTIMLDVPEFADSDDAITWGDAKITENKAPLSVYSFDPVLSTEEHFPYTGEATLVDESGVSLGTMPIEGVTYSFGSGGFSQRVEVGDIRASWDAVADLRTIDREIMLLKTSGISSRKIEHTGFEEFTQYVYAHAWANGLYNVLVSEFEEDAV